MEDDVVNGKLDITKSKIQLTKATRQSLKHCLCQKAMVGARLCSSYVNRIWPYINWKKNAWSDNVWGILLSLTRMRSAIWKRTPSVPDSIKQQRTCFKLQQAESINILRYRVRNYHPHVKSNCWSSTHTNFLLSSYCCGWTCGCTSSSTSTHISTYIRPVKIAKTSHQP